MFDCGIRGVPRIPSLKRFDSRDTDINVLIGPVLRTRSYDAYNRLEARRIELEAKIAHGQRA